MPHLHPTAFQRLRKALAEHPEVRRHDDRLRMYETFTQRFSPDHLRRLDGEALLMELHGRASHDALVYWLEFKNDPTFETRLFGSIAGGSALKFGIYQRTDDQGWYVSAAGGPGAQRKVSLAEAVGIAARQRDQLLAALDRVRALPPIPDPGPYATLQADVEAAAPDIVQYGFVHKFLHMFCPDRVDDYHSVDHQAHHLLMMGIEPSGKGLYGNAGAMVAAWRELDVPDVLLAEFTSLLNLVNGPPVRWWKVGTGIMDEPDREWVRMRDAKVVSLGYSEIGDITDLVRGAAGEGAAKERVRAAIAARWPDTQPQRLGVDTNQVWSFFHRIKENDRVLAMSGQRVLAVGRVAGPYRFAKGEPFAHVRPVEWLTLEPFKTESKAGYLRSPYNLESAHDLVQRAVVQVLEHPVVDVDRAPTGGGEKDPEVDVVPPPPPLDGRVGEIARELERKGQVVLYGPPGTGKTWYARQVAEAVVARARHGKAWAALSPAEADALWGAGPPDAQRVWACTFHPAFGYEEFVEGLRPTPVAGGLDFRPRPGLFRTVCAAASRAPKEPFVLLIDELNRGDVPRIFGELLTLLEADKRGRLHVNLPVSGDRFTVPPNVRILATMNTADRSIALLDSALRRRFSFVELMPEPDVLRGGQVWGIALDRLLTALNGRLRTALGADGRSLQVGHSFFLRDGVPLTDPADLRRVLHREVLPLLQEYCYDEPTALREIVGTDLTDETGRGFTEAALADEDTLREALLSWGDQLEVPEAAADDDA